MRIQTGNFGGAVADTVRQEPIDTSGSDAINRATQNLAGGISETALEYRQRQWDMARAKSANFAADRQLNLKQGALDIKRKVRSGEVPYQDAHRLFNEYIAQLPAPSIDGADPITLENLNRGIERFNADANLDMDAFVFGQEQDDYKGQFVQFLDTQGKLAGMPGADIEAINNSAGAAATQMAVKAGIPAAQAEKWVQDFKDQNWYNHANEKALASRNSIEGLKALESELTTADGFYSGKLDTPKRNALVSQVLTMRTQLENKLQIAADRQEIKAQRALLQMDQQISTGVPASAAQWDAWGQQVRGTPYEEGYKQRLVQEQQVQQVLRLPIDQQTAFVQQEQARLTQSGGDLHEIANLGRLTNAVQANVKQLQETPLLYAQARTNEPIQPLDFSLLDDPAGADKARAMFADRVTTLGALRKQYGEQVQQRPLLPQEAQFLTATLAKATPAQQASIFHSLSAALGDAEAYRGAMQQIAPDSPVRAQAGVLMGYSGAQMIKENWIRADDKVTAQKAATTMLVGEGLINRTSADGKADGKPVTLPIPSAEKFSTEFQAEMGDTFAGRPQAYQAAMQAVRAHYVGTSAEQGDFSPEIDTQRVRDSIRATLGQPIDFRNNKILLPWGMDETTFRNRVQVGLSEQLHALGLTRPQVNNEIIKFPRMDLMNFGDGEYLVLDGARRPYLVNGQPVSVRVGQ